jgi:hypothetical protein
MDQDPGGVSILSHCCSLWVSLPLLSLVLTVAGLLIMSLEFFLYREVIDRWYPKAEAMNIHGVLEPAGEVLQTVVFSGHHDSARVFNFFTDTPHLYLTRWDRRSAHSSH